MQNNIAIIPARGGSKRISRKNIRMFLDKPIIAYTIEAAIKSNIFDVVMVSTDDNEIAELAIKYGASVPFMRSEQNSNDHATTVDVVLEVINQYHQLGKNFNHICCCYATAPFITKERIIEGYQMLIDNNASSVFPIVEFGYPVLRSLKVEADFKVTMNWPEFLNSRSQDLPKTYHDAAQWYWIKTSDIIKTNKIFSDHTHGLKLSQLEVQDIDNETDWKLAELKYEFLQSLK